MRANADLRIRRMFAFTLRILSVPLLLSIDLGSAAAVTLREAYDLAGPGGGYDKYVVLETGTVYRGGLLIGPVISPISYEMEGEPGVNVRIVGNGAILDLQGEEICISYCENRLDIEDCVVLNGNVRFRGINSSTYTALPIGSVRHVTLYRPDDYGIRLNGAGAGITLERNLVVSAIDTGNDFVYTTGLPLEWLPTGTNISFSLQAGFFGTPVVRENWSYHEDPGRNADPLAHFSRLCEWG
jgi:hypothetical protein